MTTPEHPPNHARVRFLPEFTNNAIDSLPCDSHRRAATPRDPNDSYTCDGDGGEGDDVGHGGDGGAHVRAPGIDPTLWCTLAEAICVNSSARYSVVAVDNTTVRRVTH